MGRQIGIKLLTLVIIEMDTTRLQQQHYFTSRRKEVRQGMATVRWGDLLTLGSHCEPVLRPGEIIKKVKILRRRQVENATTSHFERFQNDQFRR